MKKLLIFALIALLFASCQDSSNRDLTEPVPSSQTIVTPQPKPINDSNTQNVTLTTPVVIPSPKPAAQNVSTLTVNPQHGAPGHRCDIAVGAPLNTPSSNTLLPSGSNNPTPNVTKIPVQSVPKNNLRLNPAHGAPGHDCTIPVGQPLKG